MEANAIGIPPKRDIRFVFSAAGENSEFGVFRKTPKKPGFGHPFLACDKAITILAQENGVEVFDNLAVFDSHAAIRDETMREQPVVVPSALVLKVLNGRVRYGIAGKMPDSFTDRLAIGFGDLDQNSVHVEHDHIGRSTVCQSGYQICSSSSRNRRI